MSDGPSKANGQYNSLAGTAKEAIGSVIETVSQAVGAGSEPSSWTTAGKEQHAKGEAEIKAAETKGYVEGGLDRLEGKKDSIVGSLTGDKTQQAKGNAQETKGEVKQSANS